MDTKGMLDKLDSIQLPFYKWPRWVEREMGSVYLASLMKDKTTKIEQRLLKNTKLTVSIIIRIYIYITFRETI